MKRYYGRYLGICVQNNDPEFRGRVKVWVPHISTALFENWNQDRKDKKFKFLGKNIDSPISGELLETLKNVLPWAEYVAPVLGSTGSAVYNSNKDQATISDSNDNSKRASTTKYFTKFKLNNDGIGEKSGRVFETDAGRVSDAFSSTINNVNRINVNAHNYKPSTYSNSAKGSFSIPNVGTHVMVHFLEGNPMHPYYDGVIFGQDDFASIYNPSQSQYEDYPQSYENDKSQTGDKAEVYRGKYVFVQKGGTIEIVNTDKRESIKWTHYSGSFKEYNNNTGIEFLSNNNQKLVLGDEFNTVNGYYSSFTGRDFERVVRGDYYKKIGNQAKDLVAQWVAAYQDIADTKALFDIRRAPMTASRLNGPGQIRTGSFANCPTCGGSGQVFGDTCGTCGGSGSSPSSQSGTWVTDPNKQNLSSLLIQKAATLAEIERKMGRGGSEIINVTKHKVETIGMMLNKFNASRIDPIGQLDTYAITIATNGVYKQQKAFPIFEKVHVDDLPGGTFSHFIGNRYEAVVGAGGYKVKTLGNIDLGGSIVSLIGDQVIVGSSNEVVIDGGKRTVITGNSIVLKSKLGKQVAVDGNFGVTNNVVIGGGAHIEGELNVHHVTAPLEFQITEPVHIKANCIIRNIATQGIQQVGDSGGNNQEITAGTFQGEIEILTDHTHYFRNLPLTLVNGKTGVRNDSKSADNTDSTTPRAAADRNDGRKASFQGTNEGPNNGPPPNS